MFSHIKKTKLEKSWNICLSFYKKIKKIIVSLNTRFFCKKIFYNKMSLKNPKTLRKCKKNLQPQMSELQFLKTQIFPKAL